MAMIDLSFLSDVVTDLNFFFTNLARSEQTKDIDMNSKTSKKTDKTNEDVSSTVVNATYSDGSVLLNLSTNDNNKDNVWKNNFYTMARTLLPQKFSELISFHKTEFLDQIVPMLISDIAGGMA